MSAPSPQPRTSSTSTSSTSVPEHRPDYLLGEEEEKPDVELELPQEPPTNSEQGEDIEKQITNINDWNGPDDPENPLNWSTAKRFYHILPPALMSFTVTLGTSIITPPIPALEEDFRISSTVAILPLSLYVVALGYGPIIAAPISETYGRKVVYLTSLFFGTMFTLGAGFSQNIWTLCILRFFAGLAFSPPLAIGPGTIADVVDPHKRAVPTALFTLSPFLGPALGPVLGAFVSVYESWRWTQWTMIFFAIFVTPWFYFTQETHKKAILARRARQLHVKPSAAAAAPSITTLLTMTIVRPLHMLVTEPIVTFLSLYVGFNFSVLFSFFAAFPYVFSTVYNFSVIESGLVFLAIGIGCVLAIPTCLLCEKYLYRPQVTLSFSLGKKGIVSPEYRLYPAMMGSFAIPIGLFWFAWTSRPSISWGSPVCAAIPFAWGNLCIFISATNYLIDTYGSGTGASAMAANGFMRYTLGAVFPLFTLQMYGGLGVGGASSLLGGIGILLMPVPWVLFKWGKQVRGRSGYDTLKD